MTTRSLLPAVFGGLTLLALHGTSISQGADPERVQRYDLEVRPGRTLVLDLDTGAGITIRGWDRNRLEAEVRLEGRDWRDTKVGFRTVSEGVRLETSFRSRRRERQTSHDIEIRVPRRFDVRIQSAGGSVHIENLEGSITGRTGGGKIHVEKARGSLSLATGGGKIYVGDSHLSGSVSTGGGKAEIVRVTGGLRASSGSGRVEYVDADGNVRRSGWRAHRHYDHSEHDDHAEHDHHSDHFDHDDDSDHDHDHDEVRIDRDGVRTLHKNGGAISMDRLPKGGRLHTGGGDVVVNSTGGDLDVDTGGGDIRVGPAAGSVRARTGAGDVHVTVCGGARGRRIEITTGSGDVRVDLPRDFSGTVDVEAAYTRNRRERARIHSDWKLPITETDRWDDRRGTPRKYVRANGKIGAGSNRLVVRTVNGSVELRRTAPPCL